MGKDIFCSLPGHNNYRIYINFIHKDLLIIRRPTTLVNKSSRYEWIVHNFSYYSANASPYENTEINNGVVSMDGETPYVNAIELTKKTDAAGPNTEDKPVVSW